MMHGTVPDTTIDPRGQLDTARTRTHTATEIEMICREFGADEVEIEQDCENHHVDACVDGLSAEGRHDLSLALREAMHPGTTVDVVLLHGSDDSDARAVLTDEELFEILQAFPDDWHETREIDISEVDMETLKPYIDRFNGLPGVCRAIDRSTEGDELEDAWNLRHIADGSEQSAEAVSVREASTPFDSDETDHDATERRDDDAVDEAKRAYVDGEIGELELEDRLEDALAERMDDGVQIPDSA